MIGRKFGDFEITAEIGKGGMGQVYRARQVSLDRDVAIKILPGSLGDVEEFRERFDVEAKAIASLVHENILQMYSKGVTEDGVHYFAMEYVDGEDLADKIKRGETFTERQALDIAAQVCRGLEAAWKKSIIHRDIKPSNIMVTKDGTVKIADFGLAKSLDATKKLTQTNMYMGTVAYTSPEQGEGRQLDQRTDIYSLGIVLYQLLTGNVPFTAETPSSVIYKHVYEAPPPPRSMNQRISPEAEAIVLKAIAKKPEDRFQNAAEFRAVLEAAVRPESAAAKATAAQAAPAVEVSSPSREELAASARAGNRTAVIVLAVLAVLLLGGSALYAAKYGYRSLLAGVLPFAFQEEKKVEISPQPAADQAVSPPSAPDAAGQGQSVPSAGTAAGERVRESRPAAAAGDKGAGSETAQSVRREMAKAAPPEEPGPPKRGAMPTVMVVISGDPNVSDIVEAVIGRRLQERSIPVAAGGELQALADQYGRRGIPMNALRQRQLRSDVLVYVTVSTMNAGPLKFYGRTMEQYAATISIKAFDLAAKSAIGHPRAKTVNFTTLNMHDNIEEATEEMVSDLPGKLVTFWKRG